MFSDVKIDYYKDPNLAKLLYQQIEYICQCANYLTFNGHHNYHTSNQVAHKLLLALNQLKTFLQHPNIRIIISHDSLKHLLDNLNQIEKLAQKYYQPIEIYQKKPRKPHTIRKILLSFAASLIMITALLGYYYNYSNNLSEKDYQLNKPLNVNHEELKLIHGDKAYNLGVDLQFTDLGWQIFSEIDEIKFTNDIECGNKKAIGCYEINHSGDSIRISDTASDDVILEIFAHEFLHTIYNQYLTDEERQTINKEINKAYKLNQDELDVLLNNYNVSEDIKLNELHSFIGTWTPNISEEFEEHYNKYLNRKAVLKTTSKCIIDTDLKGVTCYVSGKRHLNTLL